MNSPHDGNINAMLVDIGMTDIADFNDVTSYAIIIIESAQEQRNVTMGVSSDDSIKVWLNGEVVHKNAINRGRGGANEFQDEFQVNLKEGANLLMVKVSERGGGWGMNVGIDADFDHSLNFDDYEQVEFDAKGDPIPVQETAWGANRRITGPVALDDRHPPKRIKVDSTLPIPILLRKRVTAKSLKKTSQKTAPKQAMKSVIMSGQPARCQQTVTSTPCSSQ